MKGFSASKVAEVVLTRPSWPIGTLLLDPSPLLTCDLCRPLLHPPVSLQSRDRIGTGGPVVDCSRLFDNDLPDGSVSPRRARASPPRPARSFLVERFAFYSRCCCCCF